MSAAAKRSARGSAVKTGTENRGMVAVSGAAGRFGSLLVRRLHRVARVVAIDSRGFERRPADVAHRQTEPRRRECREVFRGGKVRTLVHLGPHHAESRHDTEGFAAAIENFSRLLEYCDRYDVKKLVLLSSADVYGARPNNPQFLTEEAPLLAADLSALRDVDMMAQSFFWKRPDIETVILRPVHITGGVGGAMTRYLRMSPLPVMMGYDPMIQLIHEEDLASAVALALAEGHRGIFNIAGPDPIPLSRIAQRLGRSVLPIPHPLIRPMLGQLTRMGKTDFHPAYIDYLRFVCMVDDRRARERLGFEPLRGLGEAIAAVDLWE